MGEKLFKQYNLPAQIDISDYQELYRLRRLASNGKATPADKMRLSTLEALRNPRNKRNRH